MNQLGVSRSTLREALKRLEESRLVESRPHVGWFAREVREFEYGTGEGNGWLAGELRGAAGGERAGDRTIAGADCP